MPRGWVWTAGELEVALGALGLPSVLLPFEPPRMEQTLDDRRRFEHVTLDRLRSEGIISGTGRWDPDVEVLLRLFAGQGAEAIVTASGRLADGTALHARATRSEVAGIGGWLGESGIRFAELEPDDVAAEVVDSVPLEGPADGRSITIPLGGSDDEDFQPALYDDGKPSDADKLDAARALLAKPKRGHGQFVAYGKDYDGSLIRMGQLGWIDTDDGRWMFRERRDNTGRFGEFSPATNRDFGRLIERMIRPPR